MMRQIRETGSTAGILLGVLVIFLIGLPSRGSAEESRPTSDFDYASNTLRAEVWVNHADDEVYRQGEDLQVGFEVNRDAYAVVYRIDTEGLVTVLWPRSRFDDGFVFGSHAYELPVSGARNLRVSTKEGQGVVEAVVSTYPFDLRSLELDFHHEHTADRYDFYVAGDPFLAMNEVNYAVTGLPDAEDYVITDYADYYVHQEVDHPRYLCRQCHLDDDVVHDPYRDQCTLDIQSDYSWYNGWYDRYGYYPVYGNPAYVYIDPWTLNPWVNYWYQPGYACAPWFGWGWGWGSSYSWAYSPYYWGDSAVAYSGGNARYRPLDRTRLDMAPGGRTKTREYGRGSQMVRQSPISDGDRRDMANRAGGSRGVAVVQGRDSGYRGVSLVRRPQQTFDSVGGRDNHQAGLRIRGSGRHAGAGAIARPRRHTAAGRGQAASLAPVDDRRSGAGDWRGTTRGGVVSPITVGHGRSTRAGGHESGQSAAEKPQQLRKKTTRVWRTNDRVGAGARGPARSRGHAVGHRRRPDNEATKPRKPVEPQAGSRKKSDQGAARGSGKTSPKVHRDSKRPRREPVSHGGVGRSSGPRDTGQRGGSSRR